MSQNCILFHVGGEEWMCQHANSAEYFKLTPMQHISVTYMWQLCGVILIMSMIAVLSCLPVAPIFVPWILYTWSMPGLSPWLQQSRAGLPSPAIKTSPLTVSPLGQHLYLSYIPHKSRNRGEYHSQHWKMKWVALTALYPLGEKGGNFRLRRLGWNWRSASTCPTTTLDFGNGLVALWTPGGSGIKAPDRRRNMELWK